MKQVDCSHISGFFLLTSEGSTPTWLKDLKMGAKKMGRGELISLPIEDAINLQAEQEKSFARHVPIIGPTEAKAHTEVYKIHKYWARRPHSVFSFLIQNYSKAGDTILDPFAGGGVSLVEGLHLRRRVISCDMNPVAAFIQDLQIAPVDPNKFRVAAAGVLAEVRTSIDELYATKTPSGAKAVANFFVWRQEQIIRKRYVDPETERFEMNEQTTQDDSFVRNLDKKLSSILKDNWFPKDKFPDCELQKENALHSKGFIHYSDFFTKRNLAANALLFNAILRRKKSLDEGVFRALVGTFTNTLCWTSKFAYFRRQVNGWSGHTFAVRPEQLEMNVAQIFEEKVEQTIKAKVFSDGYVDGFYKAMGAHGDDFTHSVICSSSHDLPIADKSVDVVITDPPYGGNVPYAELSDFFKVWLNGAFGTKGLIDKQFEAVKYRRGKEKNQDYYEEMLFKVFKECHRVLKPNGWMVMTFHSRDPDLWMGLHRAANRAGFRLPDDTVTPNHGLVYQPPVNQYAYTSHSKKDGAMKGDTICSFMRLDAPMEKWNPDKVTKAQELQMKHFVYDLLTYHGSVDESEIMSALVVFLQEKGWFSKVASFNFERFLSDNFRKDEGKWQIKDEPEVKKGTKLRPVDFLPAEQLTKTVISEFLAGSEGVSYDEIIMQVYSTLVNSYRPGVEMIHKVVEQITKKIGSGSSTLYVLKGRYVPLQAVKGRRASKATQGELGLVDPDMSLHDQCIKDLAIAMNKFEVKSHIGDTEKRKTSQLRTYSMALPGNVDLGLPLKVYQTLRQVDLVLFRENSIFALVEIATSVETLNKAINDRFRNIFSAAPNLGILGYCVVNDSEKTRAKEILYSLANTQINLPRKVRIYGISQLNDLVKQLEQEHALVAATQVKGKAKKA